MYYILYLSVSAELMNDDELKSLLAHSRLNNRKMALTGVLLYGNGRFIQLLEGSRDQVEQTFQVIRSDRRHLDITVIASGEIGKRYFPEWLMAFKSIRPARFSEMEGFLDLSRASIQNNDSELPVKLLQSFVRTNRMDGV